ncbi:VOC family protein [Nocardioides sp.]|uniref:VOC family protein n=1 Tax=Nocardioides sp. TaxID=35761 RepID=UPI000C953C3B|nr:VOC family protein [Nocardioides sp.]MAS54687.1 glyoxalase [Pimelobacter sp.]MDE0775358.1 VOC family protein [Nocardioides sp.]
MATPWGVTFDCHDAQAMAAFWTVALGYVDASPPQGWDTWEDWLRHFDVPEDEWGDGASLVDPDGVLPRVGFLKVPEGKVAKNRLHLDLWVSGGRHVEAGQRDRLIRAMVDRLLAVGGTVLEKVEWESLLDHVVLQDPEGNELCVA